MRTDPFRDEVAVDFPAATRCLERARDGFLTEAERGRSDRLTAEIRVSLVQAHCGAVVPLAVHLRGACPACGGRGESWAEICADCGGSGDNRDRHMVRVPVPPGVAHGARLHFRIRQPDEPPVRVEIRVAIGQDLTT